jgi:uncharacterized protein YndB with AHSA1/START domain
VTPAGEATGGDTGATRSLVKEIAINAPPDAVWRALTDAEELRRWFPLDARVEPGKGGKIWVSWGEGMDGEQGIDIWEPGKHLRTSVQSEGMPVPFATDYYIEVRGDTTVLRLVNSGFGAGAEWDDMYFGMDGGWSYFLFNLRHYLERHAGRPRSLAFVRRKRGVPRASVVPSLLAALGHTGGTPAAGDPVSITLGDRRYEGRVALVLRDHLAMIIPGLDDALLFFELEPGADPHLGMYLSTYGTGPQIPEGLQHSVESFITGLGGEAAPQRL